MRQLDIDHKKLWDQLRPPSEKLKAGTDCDPVLLSGWTDQNISLWDVSASNGKPSLIDILIALCRNKPQNWEKIIFLLFPADTVTASGLTLTESNGKTGYQKIDVSKTHYELKNITGKELCTLLYHISISDFKIGVFSKKDYQNILYKAYEAYENTSKLEVIGGATSQIPQISLPSSATKSQPMLVTSVPEDGSTKDSLTEKIPPSSSTTLITNADN